MEKMIQEIVARTSFSNEADVKRVVRQIMDQIGGFHFMPPSNAYGKSGIADILYVCNGRAVAVETKYGYRKPTAPQKNFGKAWAAADGLFVVINEKNIVPAMRLIIDYVQGERDVPRYNEKL